MGQNQSLVKGEVSMRSNIKNIMIFALSLGFSVIICQDAHADIFDSLSQKAISFAVNLRYLAYVLSGFGIIMFTYLAISGKINFKHLGYISISLFILAAMGALIDYVTTNDRNKLTYSTKFSDTYKKASAKNAGDLCQSGICR
jgi:hypothetical protein